MTKAHRLAISRGKIKANAARIKQQIKRSPYVTDERVMVRFGNRLFTCKPIPMKIYAPIE